MGKQITQRIALEGGQQFRDALKALGQAGQEAFKSLADGADKASAAAVKLAPVIDAVEKKIAQLKKSGQEVGESFDNAKDKFKTTGERVALLVAGVVALSAAFVNNIVQAGKTTGEIKRMAEGLGLTVQEFQRLSYWASQFGVDAETLQKVLTRMDSKVAESNKFFIEQAIAQDKLSNQFALGKITFDQYLDQQYDLQHSAAQITNIFNRLGISIYDDTKATQSATGVVIGFGQALNHTGDISAKFQRPLADNHTMIQRLAKVFPTLDNAMKAVVATELGFSRNKALISALNEGEEGLKRFEAEAERVAPSLSNFQVAVGDKLEQAFAKLQKAVDSTALSARLMFAPDVTRLLNAFTDAVVAARPKLIEYALALVDQIKPLIDDVVKALNGEELDPNSFVAKARTAVLQFVKDVEGAGKILAAAWEGLLAFLDPIARIINRLFGTDISAQAIALAAAFAAFTGILGAVFSALSLVFTVVGALSASFGLLNVAIAAAGVIAGYWLGQYFLDLLVELKKGWDGWAEYLPKKWQEAVSLVTGIWSGGLDFLSGKFTEWKNYIMDGLKAIADAFKSIAAKLGLSSGPDNGGSGGAQQFADGGQVRGPGTGTSDSVPIWASNGEWVMRARAVAHYGAGFMDRINRLQLPKFSTGGLVDGLAGAMGSIMPRTHFADGGLVSAIASGSSGRPVYVQIGDATFGPLTAGEATVTGLERFAANRQARSAGRRPTWSGSR